MLEQLDAFNQPKNTAGIVEPALADETSRPVSEPSGDNQALSPGLFKQLSPIALVLDRQTAAILDANPRACALYGYSPDEFASLDITDLALLTPEALLTHLNPTGGAAMTPFNAAQRMANGDIREAEIYSSPVTYRGQRAALLVIHDITHIKQVEKPFAGQTKLLPDAPDAVFAIDEHNRVTYFNQAAEQLFGWTAAEALGQSGDDLIPARYLDVSRSQAVTQLVETGHFEGEVAYRRKDGSSFYALIRSAAMYSSAGVFKGQFASVREITETRMLRQRALLERDLARALAEISSIRAALILCLKRILTAADLDSGGVYLVDRRTGDLELVGSQGLSEGFIAMVRSVPVNSPRWKVVMQGKPIYVLYKQIRSENSSELANEGLRAFGFIPVTHQDKVIACFNLASHDSDEIPPASRELIEAVALQLGNALVRIMAEEDLRDSQSKLQLAIDGANLGMWDWDVQSGRTIINDRWAEMVGYTLEELQPVSIQTRNDFCHPDDLRRAEQLLQQHFDGLSDYYQCEVRMKHKNGGWIWVLDRGKVLEWDDRGRPVRMLGSHLDISERKQLEATIEKRERRFRALLENSSDAITLMNARGESIYEGPNNFNLTGYQPEEILGRPLIEEVHPDDRVVAQAGFERLLAVPYGQARDELRLVRKDGRVWWAELTFTNLLHHPDVEGVVVNYQDITSRKHADSAIRQVEKRNRALIENAPDGITLLDAKGRFTFGSPPACRIFGYSQEEIIGQPLRTWIHPEDAQALNSRFIRLVLSPAYTSFTMDYRFMHKDGRYRWIEGTFTNLLGEKGVIAVVNNFRDITQARFANEQLQKSQSSLELAQSIARLGSYENNPFSGEGLSWSKEMYHLFQRDPALGVPSLPEFLEMIHPDDQARFLDADQQVMLTGEPVALEYRALRGDQQLRHISAIIQPVKDEQGALLHLAGTALDITEIKQIQLELETLNGQLEMRVAERTMELQDANQALEKAMRSRDEFLATVSHELRTPLIGILGMADVLKYKIYGDLNEKQLDAVQHIEIGGKRLNDMVNDVLDFAQLQSSRFALQIAPCSLGNVCMSSLQAVKSKASAKNLQIEFCMTPESIMLNADARRLKQVLGNLLGNAIKFTPEGGRIDLVVTGGPGEVQISVADTGIGIKAEDLARLFQPFAQLDAKLARMYEGTGLGLALVKALVELHGGWVDAQSEFGTGSTFTVGLPWNE